MGKVYEALKRAEKEKQPIFSPFGSEGREGRRGAVAAARKKSDEFDFVDYSLNTPSAEDLRTVLSAPARTRSAPDFAQQSIGPARPRSGTRRDADRSAPGHLLRFRPARL